MGGVDATLATIHPDPAAGGDVDDQVGYRCSMDVADRNLRFPPRSDKTPARRGPASPFAVPVGAIARDVQTNHLRTRQGPPWRAGAA